MQQGYYSLVKCILVRGSHNRLVRCEGEDDGVVTVREM